ncbi:monovalent cation/H+ antiporter subunit A [Phaeovulum sp.]|uniref:monovalent cation/H+ antiporter subunit A n=1 Tax=Phaeovulum sp. TaxID=2934796 RepID=UPI0027313272|nr:monovalent cation/H+ antiporter subunit A [Phaeovulum sp.]MDP1668998.1 monovalent cation/H+ antiporter subunit A [Phaeovulum sp.]MDZ4117967.1 monovalent cation/H+ antiporter subunit A [Phaeovulum sp.]
MSLLLIVILPFLGALLPAVLIRSGRGMAAAGAGLATAAALAGVLAHLPRVFAGKAVVARLDWLPALGLSASFRLDGLAALFAILILGIGLLILFYARYYLAKADPAGRFFTYLMLFQGAMLGIVLSNNILLLLIFWELTSLSSFLLIGYWSHRPDARAGALMALVVTATGGLAMIAGMLVLGGIAGSYEISEIVKAGPAIRDSGLYPLALGLILLGAFTKSAQFPFHFWLPRAMAAPTPVSAYLHSATMVKAGVFLLARLWPALSGTSEWFYVVTTVGLVTMLWGASVALFRTDLKALLAYSTVSHLGLIVMLLGFGSKAAALAAVFHVLNHASFKAALFLSAGIIEHETGTRDIDRLGGLRRLMPLTFALATLAALSMAGVPLLNGFLSKEMMLEEAAHTTYLGGVWLLAALTTLGALISAGYSFRLIVLTFLGQEREDYPTKPHDPAIGLWLAPALLVAVVVVVGLFPALARPLVAAAAGAVVGADMSGMVLKIWHGLTPALAMSAIALAGGALLLTQARRLQWAGVALARLSAPAVYAAIMTGAEAGARRLSAALHDGAMARSLAALVLVALAAGGWAFASAGLGPETRAMLPVPPVVAVGWLALIVASLLLPFLHRDRLLALVLIGIIGLMVSIGFIYLSAPDLALTQITVEVVTVVLMLLALNFLPKQSIAEPFALRARDAGLASAAGLGVGALIYALMRRDFAAPTISAYHVENSYSGGGGTNIVNVILVDFRGYDTFGEIIVLGIAALVIFALADVMLRRPALRRLIAWTPDQPRAGDAHPLMLVVTTRLVLPVALMVGVYIFLRGHNAPGGGFVAGLVVSIALVMQYMASGLAWAEARLRFDYHALIGAGVLIAGLTGIGAWFAGRPFLTSAFGYVTLPPLEKFELATAMAFDLGVFLTVVGAVMLALASLSRLSHRTHHDERKRGETG